MMSKQGLYFLSDFLSEVYVSHSLFQHVIDGTDGLLDVIRFGFEEITYSGDAITLLGLKERLNTFAFTYLSDVG